MWVISPLKLTIHLGETDQKRALFVGAFGDAPGEIIVIHLLSQNDSSETRLRLNVG
ncbi:MAG: hypothetical protein SynsKO_39010 [Synoicihabitans sp.]